MIKQISTKQFIAIQFLLTIAMKMFLLPALMLRIVGKDSYVVMAVYLLIETINLGLLLLTALRNPDKTLFEILKDGLGKIVSKAIISIFAIFCFMRCVLMISELKMFFSTTMYEQINWGIMVLPLIALLCAFSSRSLRATGRVSEILLPIIVIATLLLSTLLLGDMDLSQLLPFGEGGTKPILEGLMTFPMWFGDTAFLLLTLGKIKLSRGVVIGSMLTKLIASILIMLFSCTLFATYSNISTLIDYGNNVSNMTQFSLGSQDYGRFDLLFYCVWLFSVFIALAMVFRALTRSVEYVIGKTSRNHLLVTTIVAIILYITITFVLKNENTVYEFMTSAIKYVVYFPTVMLPTITLISSVIKYKPNRHLLTKKEKANETTFSTE